MASVKNPVADIVLTGLVLYASIWVYELSNYISMTLSGAKPFLSVQGIFPVGVIAVLSGSPAVSLTKLVQVAICASVAVGLLWAFRNRQLPFTKIALVTAISLYIASFQWEFLPQAGYVTEAVHQGSFLIMTVLLGALVISLFRKPLHLGIDSASPA
jgi:hypothetical protein